MVNQRHVFTVCKNHRVFRDMPSWSNFVFGLFEWIGENRLDELRRRTWTML